MSCFPFRNLWSCCCDRRTILEETESPPRTRSRSRKPKSLKHHRNTRVRIARDTGASSVSARRSASSTHRRHSYNPEKHSRSHSVGGTDADGRARSSHSHSHRRSRSGTEASQSETRARRRRSGSGVDGRAAAERALSGDRSGMSRADSGHRRAKVSAANSSLGYGEGHFGGGSGEKRHSGRRGSHDDSGYRTEERRSSSRRAALANRQDTDVARAATDGQYYPRPANGTLATSEQDTRAGILKPGSTGVHDSIVDMLRDHDRKATRAEAEQPKSSRYRAKAGDAAAAGYSTAGRGGNANGNSDNPRAGIVNMLDHSAADNGEPAPRKRVSKKDAAYHRSKDDVSGIRKNIVNMLSHDSQGVERKPETSHAAGTSAHTRRHRSRSDASGARKGIVNMHAHDDSDGDARASKLSRSKSAGHRSSSHRTAATIAAEATQTNTNGDILRRKSTRGKRIREEDVDPNWRNPDDSDSEEEAAAARASGGGHVNGTQKRRTEKKAKESRSGSGSNSRSNRDASQPEGSSEAQKRRLGSSKTSINKGSTAAEASGPAAARTTTTVADPQAQTTAYMPEDIARIAREALRRPPLRSRGAYATEAQATTATATSSAAPIAPPTYTYREDGPLLQTEAEHYEALTSHIASQQLEPLFPPENPRPKAIASRAATQSRRVRGVCEDLELSKWANVDLARIGLYDVIVFCDDSGSMMRQQRYETLKAVVRRITLISAAYNTDGVRIRFINSTLDSGFNGIVTEEQVNTCLDLVVPNNGTALGTNLITKVVQPLILQRAHNGELRRPVIVSIVTDGQPEGESEDMLKHAIVATKTELKKFSPPGGGRYGPSAVVFQVAQVGDSPAARRYVRALKEDPQIAGMVYCTHESLDDAMGNSQTRGQLNTWLTQVLAGTIRL